ncbi:MAG: hypothetical protein AAB691_03930 [Patescibacteria group bacterium]
MNPPQREKLPPRVSDLHTHARREKRKTLLIFGSVFLIILGVVAWWLFIQSRVLRFDTFAVEGNTRLTDQEIITLLKEKVIAPKFFSRFLGQDHFFIWPRAISSKQVRTLGNLKNISFDRDIVQHRLTITVEEYQFFATICLRKNDPPKCFWFDKDGNVFEDAFFPEGILVFRLDDSVRENLALGDAIYPPEKQANLLSVFTIIKELELETSAWTIRANTPDILEVQVLDGPLIYFNLQFPSAYTGQIIRSLIGQKGLRNIEYIDFRIENRVYYKDA